MAALTAKARSSDPATAVVDKLGFHNRLVASLSLASPTTQSCAKTVSERRGNVFNFPRLWRVQRRESQSLWPERAVVARKSLSGLWPRQTLSRRETAALTETGSTAD